MFNKSLVKNRKTLQFEAKHFPTTVCPATVMRLSILPRFYIQILPARVQARSRMSRSFRYENGADAN